jgi:RimJ/RimL family protein N-acetyltransferase
VSWTDETRPLEGRLVVLEPLAPEHEAALREAAQDAEIWRFGLADFGAFFARWWDAAVSAQRAGTEIPFATVERTSGRVVGSSRFMTLRPEHRGLEIGSTWVVRELWGSGVNVEAKLLMLEHAFERLGCARVEFKTEATNERSRAALAALPARFEGIFRKHMLVRGGEWRDSAFYSVVDDDWPQVRAGLERRVSAKASAVS